MIFRSAIIGDFEEEVVAIASGHTGYGTQLDQCADACEIELTSGHVGFVACSTGAYSPELASMGSSPARSVVNSPSVTWQVISMNPFHTD
jgi:hypothetical protein